MTFKEEIETQIKECDRQIKMLEDMREEAFMRLDAIENNEVNYAKVS